MLIAKVGCTQPNSKHLLQALLVSMKQKAMPDEDRPQPEVFADEVKKLVAQPQELRTQDIVASTQNSIDELGEMEGENRGKAAMYQMMLGVALEGLKPILAKEVENN